MKRRTVPNSRDWFILDQAHRKRNLAEYEGVIDVEENLVLSLLKVTEEIRALVSSLNSFFDTVNTHIGYFITRYG